MSIDSIVKEVYEGVFKRNPLLCLGIDVEGEVVMTLDFHKLIVQSENRSKQRLLLKVSPE